MRRVLLFLASICVISLLAGCHLYHWHGVCDCQMDDYCSSRSPWIRTGAVAPGLTPAPVEYVAPPGTTVPAPMPAKLPDAKKAL
ncbi:MAG TPA: hypothetical protein VFE62_11735 [Gemmataceae bacterium]|nr:hypothetical protein [Gemmataceae bacterium]